MVHRVTEHISPLVFLGVKVTLLLSTLAQVSSAFCLYNFINKFIYRHVGRYAEHANLCYLNRSFDTKNGCV